MAETLEYLVRYGLMGHVGMFRQDSSTEFVFERGQAVVIQTDRGIEMGEVLVRLGESSPFTNGNDRRPDNGEPGATSEVRGLDRRRLLRPASAADLDQATRSDQLRSERFKLCQELIDEEDRPLELIDVEPLLEQSMTVLHFLGPRELDLARLRARFRSTCDFDVVFEPVGADAGPEPEAPEPSSLSSTKTCGNCNCGAKSPKPASEEDSDLMPSGAAIPEHDSTASCGTSAHAGCASCGIARLLAAGRGARAKS
jgi:hypothetical protein